MNYKQLVKLADDEKQQKGDNKFYHYFLACVHKTQELTKIYKKCDPELKIMVKTKIKDYADTLKCFYTCTK